MGPSLLQDPAQSVRESAIILVDLVIQEKGVQIKTKLLLEKKLMSCILPAILQSGLHEQLWDSIEISNN